MEDLASSFFSQPLTTKLILVGIFLAVFFVAVKLLKSGMRAIFLVAVVVGLTMTYYFIRS